MKTRSLGRCGLVAGEVGLGCEHLQGKDAGTVTSVVHAALDRGMNLLDVFRSEPQVRTDIGRALRGRRDKALLQGHIGAVWEDGQYRRSRDPEKNRQFFDDFCARLQTDVVDIGMLHFVDTQEDFDAVFGGPILEEALRLKASGRIRALGMSSHSPVVAQKAVETGHIDVLMFSLNPAYDLLPEDLDMEYLFQPETYRDEGIQGIRPAREALYQTCAAKGVGITVMKAYGGGALLHAKPSPFGVAMTPVQCIHYALTRPAVASVLAGCATVQEVEAAAAYANAPEAARDYTAVLTQKPRFLLEGKCMYCNHCLPCPSRIDIAQVNKYLDLALLQEQTPETVAAHYQALESHASDCIRCGHCERNCPFSVPVIERMERATAVFGC